MLRSLFPTLGRLRAALFGLLLVAATPVQAEVRVTDDLGRTLVLAQPAERIVSLAPHLTELAFAVGAGGQVVGVDLFSNHPPEAAALPRVGEAGRLDFEALLALKPDVVLAWHSGNPRAGLARLESLGIPVFYSEPRRLDDIPPTLARLGRLAGRATAGEAAAAQFRAGHAALAARYADASEVRVFYQIWNRPLMTINGEHLISDVIALCGGRNVFANVRALTPTVEAEAVLAADPEAIVVSGAGAERPEWIDEWRRWPMLSAVRDGHLFVVDPDLIQRHSPRVLQGAERVCEALQEVRDARQ